MKGLEAADRLSISIKVKHSSSPFLLFSFFLIIYENIENLICFSFLLVGQGLICVSGVLKNEAIAILKKFYDGENPHGWYFCSTALFFLKSITHTL
jgi:hypothetical protein